MPLACARTHSAPSLVLPAPRPPSMSHVVQGPPPLPCNGGSWWRWASVMKSLSNRGIHRSVGGATHNFRVSPARDEFFNAARKRVTEFVDIGGHVGIIRSIAGGGWLHALQLLQGFREARERPRGPHGAGCVARVN